MNQVSILASGMVTAVGLDAASSCAAIRCAIDNFSETRFMGRHGEWFIGSPVPLTQPWRGLPKLVRIAAPAIRECLSQIRNTNPNQIPLLLCVAERERPGRLEGLDDQLFREVEAELCVRFHQRSSVFSSGRVGGALALDLARRLICEDRRPYAIVAGVDTLLLGATLAAYDEDSRLLTSKNPDGFIPGEAAAAVLVGPVGHSAEPGVLCLGVGTGHEKATLASGEPLRAEGLVQAFQAALADSRTTFADLDYRLTDCNGEQYWFKEAALAIGRTMRVRKEQFDIWHPADCIGETGAAAGPCALAVALAAARKCYAPGQGVLCHFGSDNGERAAVILRKEAGRSAR